MKLILHFFFLLKDTHATTSFEMSCAQFVPFWCSSTISLKHTFQCIKPNKNIRLYENDVHVNTQKTITKIMDNNMTDEWEDTAQLFPSFSLVNSSRLIWSISEIPWWGLALHRLNWQHVKQYFEPSIEKKKSVQKNLQFFYFISCPMKRGGVRSIT